MNFDTTDLILIDILLGVGTKIESCCKKTLEYKFELTGDILSGKTFEIASTKNNKSNTPSTHSILYFGFYNKVIKKFCWVNNANEFILETIIKESNLWGNDKYWKKLLVPEVEINLDEHNAIVYLSTIIFNKSNLVKFENDDFIAYTMIKLDIDCEIDYENFFSQLLVYKNIIEKKSTNLKRNVNMKKNILINIKKLSKKIKKSPFKLGKRLEGKLNKKLFKNLSRTQIKKFIKK
jgi:hypothetical protein